MQTDFIIFTISKLTIRSSKYKAGEDRIPHFLIFTVVGLIDIFTRDNIKNIYPKPAAMPLPDKTFRLKLIILKIKNLNQHLKWQNQI